jgi:uncharacterized protein YmfQ (DUF2313 family)
MLLPRGQAWSRDPETVQVRVWNGLSQYWGVVDGRAADLLETESDPRRTTELLPDWERNWGLPDPCYTAPQSIGDRQRALVQRMTMLGGQSRQWFIDFAAYIGYTISISEYRPFMAGLDRCGDNRVYGDGTNPMFSDMFVCGYLPVCGVSGTRITDGELSEYPNYGLAAPEIRYYWTVHVSATSLTWFRCGSGGGQCGVDPHLLIGVASDLECILARWKPAHTQIIFDYANLAPGGPMTGTP